MIFFFKSSIYIDPDLLSLRTVVNLLQSTVGMTFSFICLSFFKQEERAGNVDVRMGNVPVLKQKAYTFERCFSIAATLKMWGLQLPELPSRHGELLRLRNMALERDWWRLQNNLHVVNSFSFFGILALWFSSEVFTTGISGGFEPLVHSYEFFFPWNQASLILIQGLHCDLNPSSANLG